MKYSNLAFVITAMASLQACGKVKTKPCPAAYHDASADQKAGTLVCLCDASANRGSVWGSHTYTTDSSICKAAIHAGALPASGVGVVTVKAAPGCPSYSGSTANGVTTSSWGTFGSSFYFVGHGDERCDAKPESPAGPCPDNLDVVTDPNTTQLTCQCATIPASGSVWGVGTYTSDSSICRAAVHAGAIPPSGGNVTVKRAAGCSAYKGSTANGIQTNSWGSHGASFYFDGYGTGGC